MRITPIYSEPLFVLWQIDGDGATLGFVERDAIGQHWVHQLASEAREPVRSVADGAILLWRGSVWSCPISEFASEFESEAVNA